MMRNSTKYKDTLKRVRQLSRAEQVRLIEALATSRRAKKNHKKHSVLELEGLGKQIWNGIDAQEYVRRERASWVG